MSQQKLLRVTLMRVKLRRIDSLAYHIKILAVVFFVLLLPPFPLLGLSALWARSLVFLCSGLLLTPELRRLIGAFDTRRSDLGMCCLF